MKYSTKRVQVGLGVGVLAVVGLTLSNPSLNLISMPSGRRIAYDYSVETRPGTPIQVLQAIDGDTVELINGDRLRYIGIDTPESLDQRKPVQCFAKEAARKNKELVEGKMITFAKDVSERDIYGRWLGYVTLLDGTLVNEALVRSGHAFSYSFPPDISKQDVFRKAEQVAQKEKRGLWTQCDVHTIGSGRKQTNPVD